MAANLAETAGAFEYYLAIGLAMTLLSLFCLAINLVVLRIILVEKELRRLTSYKFMFALGLADCLQLGVHLVTGLFTIWQTILHPWLNKLLGAIVTPAYVFYAVLTIVLAINRLVSLSSMKLDNFLFSSQGTTIWLSASGLLAFGFSLALASPWASILYFPDELSWAYDSNMEFSQSVQFCEMAIEIGGIALSGLLYFAIFCLIFRKKKYFVYPPKQPMMAPNQCQQSPPSVLIIELKLLVQAVVITAYCTILNFLWHNSERLLPHTKWANCALNFMWIANGAVNPLIYFAVNVAIRQRIATIFGLASRPIQKPEGTKMVRRRSNNIDGPPPLGGHQFTTRIAPMRNNFVVNGKHANNWTPPKSA